MNKTHEVFAKSRRLTILKLLAEQPDYAVNTSVLRTALATFAFGESRDTVEADAVWLDEQGLAVREVLEGMPVTILKITGRGMDVAQGLATHPGVDRPTARL
jgi:hypothetical protein